MYKLIESNGNGIKEVLSREKIVWEVKNGNCVKKLLVQFGLAVV